VRLALLKGVDRVRDKPVELALGDVALNPIVETRGLKLLEPRPKFEELGGTNRAYS